MQRRWNGSGTTILLCYSTHYACHNVERHICESLKRFFFSYFIHLLKRILNFIVLQLVYWEKKHYLFDFLNLNRWNLPTAIPDYIIHYHIRCGKSFHLSPWIYFHLIQFFHLFSILGICNVFDEKKKCLNLSNEFINNCITEKYAIAPIRLQIAVWLPSVSCWKV